MEITLVQPYDPAWPSQFEQMRTLLEGSLQGVDYSIEHVGSTAIPGMVAKPIIDLDIVVVAKSFPTVKERLEALGYVHQGDLGVPKREAFKLLDEKKKASLPAHHLYVCEDGAYELRKHLVFRDFMRRHPEWRERLSQLKKELCLKHNNDREAYIDGKAAMVEEITELAMTEKNNKGDEDV